MTTIPVRQIILDEAKVVWPTCITDETILPFMSYQWYVAWLSVHPGWQSYILFINNSTIAPFVRKDDTVQFIYAYTDFDDLVGVNTPEIWSSVLDYLKHEGIKKAELAQIPENSKTVDFFKTYAENNSNCTIAIGNTTPFIALPTTFEEYLASIREKRKKYNKFRREFPQARIELSDDPSKDVEQLLSLMKQNSIKEASATIEKETFFRKVAGMKDALLTKLSVDDKVVAMQIAFSYKQTMMLYISGYDKTGYANAGTYLIVSSIKQAIVDGYKKFNFLRGREQYKYELGAKDFALYTITVNL